MNDQRDRRAHVRAGTFVLPRGVADRRYKSFFGGGGGAPPAPPPVPVDDSDARRRAEELRLARRRRSGFSGAILTTGLGVSGGDESEVRKKKLLGE